MFAGNAGAGEDAQQLMPIPGVDRVAQSVEVVAKYVQCTQHGLAIGEEDIVPHHRITAGDPREITETASGIAENLQVLAALGQRIDQGEGQQMREMTGGREHLIMMLHLHDLDICAQLPPQALDKRQGSIIAVLARRENDLVATEQLGVRSLHPALLGAGNGMPRHQAHGLAGEGLARSAQHIALGTAHIGQHGTPRSNPASSASTFSIARIGTASWITSAP